MALIGIDNWLKTPLDRDIIAHWTVGAGQGMEYALDMPQPADPQNFSFLALGDTGDSEAAGPHVSPQDAVAREMARDSALPDSAGRASFVLHTGDVIYMTGERRLYDRNFRRPYADFLAPQSVIDNLVFRLPFLPVPGNHDYYDLRGWTRWLARIPILGAGLRAIAHELFAFSLPEGGSEMGKAYMQAFVDLKADTREHALLYRPDEQTRLPNRYYKFRMGTVDFFALDSNTLDGPPPGSNQGQVHADAAQRMEALQKRAGELDLELRRHQLVLERSRQNTHQATSTDVGRQEAVTQASARVSKALADIQAAVQQAQPAPMPCADSTHIVAQAQRRWDEAAGDLLATEEPEAVLRALQALEEASDEGCKALGTVEGCLGVLPEGTARTQMIAARDALQQALHQWSQVAELVPYQETLLIHQLSEDALDVQRELALERRRLRYRPEDYDTAQLEWLDRSLAAVQQERPDGWRIVYLHHPLYTTISNHCERPDVQGLRGNIMALLQKRGVHLILSGHSHTFEWFRSRSLPHAGVFVTGGGGQIALRPALFASSHWSRQAERYAALRGAGVEECAIGGRGPSAADGEAGLLYHYLRIEVTPTTLRVHPVGVRRLDRAYRREEPMPVYSVPHLPTGKPDWTTRRLESVEIRRDAPPQPHWV